MTEKFSLKESISNWNKTFHNDYNFICDSLKTILFDTKFDSNLIFWLLKLKTLNEALLAHSSLNIKVAKTLSYLSNYLYCSGFSTLFTHFKSWDIITQKSFSTNVYQ